uniref:zinc finger protein VAR3, chloroplastic-like n=1 Tax=Erigeron canadensis TaxID=72917 RepID=UPI001CB8F143|nr:zinc finger protein VAR3, chloroplastic-like [Erigeron canadensis]
MLGTTSKLTTFLLSYSTTTTTSLPLFHRPSTHHNLSHFPIKSSQQFHSHFTTTNNNNINKLRHHNHVKPAAAAAADVYLAQPSVSHPWPEWSTLIKSISIFPGCIDTNRNGLKDEFVPIESLSMEFIDAACFCLSFAHLKPHILRWLPKDEMQVLINDGAPFLFKSAIETEKRMRSFLEGEKSSEATTVDLMKYILSYASNPVIHPEKEIKEASESSARNLLREMANLIGKEETLGMHNVEEVDGVIDEKAPIYLAPNIIMKRSDWICRKCSFMNFAKNAKCLRCEELRSQRQLTGAEWDCPRCSFFNNGRNMVCLKCEVRRPGEVPLPIGQVKTPAIPNERDSGYVPFVPLPADIFAKNPENKTTESNKKAVGGNSEPKITGSKGNSEKSATKSEISIKDTVEAEKSERWFKKVAELHDVTDLTSAISDEDFPEIMPIRKGENRFVVSKKKDRSLTSSTYKRQQAIEQGSKSINFVPFVPFPPDYFAKKDNQQSKDTSLTRMSDENQDKATNGIDLVKETEDTQINRSETLPETSNGDRLTAENQHVRNGLKGKGVEGPATDDMSLVQEKHNAHMERSVNGPETSSGVQHPEIQKLRNRWEGSSLEGSAVKETDPLDMSEEAKAERWFRRVAQIKDISELSQIPDEDFPSIMPMRKGVNRFVVSKRKTPLERRLTSPQYRKNLRTVNSEPTKKEGEGS